MPCNSDYMEPRGDERNTFETARHLRRVLMALGRESEITPTMIYDAESLAPSGNRSTIYYPRTKNLEGYVVALCAILKSLTEAQSETIIYDAHDPEARKLATWWEQHQKADREREHFEAMQRRVEAAKESAKAKLTPEELEALGIR